MGFCGHPSPTVICFLGESVPGSPSLQQGPLPALACRLPETTVVYPADVVLFEGILVFYSQEIRDMFHLRLFVDTDSDVRLSRRGKALGLPAPGRGWAVVPGSDGGLLAPVAAVLRDVNRGRDLEQILTQYTTFVKPAFEEFCLPVPPALSPSWFWEPVGRHASDYKWRFSQCPDAQGVPSSPGLLCLEKPLPVSSPAPSCCRPCPGHRDCLCRMTRDPSAPGLGPAFCVPRGLLVI